MLKNPGANPDAGYAALAADDQRNELIVDDVIAAVDGGRSPVVLTERREHLEHLAATLDGRVAHIVVLRGGMGVRQRRAVTERLAAIPASEARVLVATGRYLDEGFDDARLGTLLDTLFLAPPISWRGTLAQYAGRLHRLNDAKTEVHIYDYVNLQVPMLARMHEKRLRGYRAMGSTPWACSSPLWGDLQPRPTRGLGIEARESARR